MYQPLIKFHPHPAIFTQVLFIFVEFFMLPLSIVTGLFSCVFIVGLSVFELQNNYPLVVQSLNSI